CVVAIHQVAQSCARISTMNEQAMAALMTALIVDDVPVVGLLPVLRTVNVNAVAGEAAHVHIANSRLAAAHIDAVRRAILRPGGDVVAVEAGSSAARE